MRVVFMGTPEFAVPSLAALLEAGYEVAGVFTQPDRPAGRGNKLAASPVKQLALANGLDVYQFERVSKREGREAIERLAPDALVTAAFGQILSRRILAIPPLGTINVHASLLPAYRGPAPVNWCLVKGEERAGVTTMFTDAGVDTGDMALSEAVDILPDETAGELLARLAPIGARLLIDTLKRVEAGDCPRAAQDEARASYFSQLSREDGLVDWTRGAREIVNLARGLNPWPCAHALYQGGQLKIYAAKTRYDVTGQPGEVLISSPKDGLVVACGDGAVEITQLQAPGAKRMDARAFLRGKHIACGTRLGEAGEA